MLAHRLDRPEAGEVEVAGGNAVPSSEVPDEVLRDAELLLGISRCMEPGDAAHAVDEERVEVGVDGPHVRDRYPDRFECAEDLRFALEGHEMSEASEPAAAELHEEVTGDAAGVLHVDEVAETSARGHRQRVDDLTVRHVLDPRDDLR